MMELHVYPAAADEVDEAIAYFGGLDDGIELALDFERTYLRYEEAIATNPLLFNLRRRQTRRVNLTPRFGEYYIAYTLWRDRIIILALGHAKRLPYYWRNRISAAKEMFE